MNKFIITALLIVFTGFFSSLSYATEEEESRCRQSENAVKMATYGHMDARALKAMIDSSTSFLLLDSRGHKWHDGNKIPGAKLASYEYSAEEIEQVAPNKEELIVVYCFTFNCPLSRRLADKLVEFGYVNVIEYPGGLEEWRDVANYPTEIIEETDR